jgi:hypothetical protein
MPWREYLTMLPPVPGGVSGVSVCSMLCVSMCVCFNLSACIMHCVNMAIARALFMRLRYVSYDCIKLRPRAIPAVSLTTSLSHRLRYPTLSALFSCPPLLVPVSRSPFCDIRFCYYRSDRNGRMSLRPSQQSHFINLLLSPRRISSLKHERNNDIGGQVFYARQVSGLRELGGDRIDQLEGRRSRSVPHSSIHLSIHPSIHPYIHTSIFTTFPPHPPRTITRTAL